MFMFPAGGGSAGREGGEGDAPKILRGTAELTKAANVQHEATHSLLSHRQRTLEDKRMLAEEKKEHQWRSRIAHRTALS
ncbi:hypothetical protein GBAR_LOCUS10684 [Geodia barretti]|uniref:Uncharacterized protein n=1 Tax=Geodia barretti TaxID=519541 RepID=A0AA35RTW6_GEOBA|nr:hypothetical protein GBAR_LOCUS10684 [Geodia barretti]